MMKSTIIVLLFLMAFTVTTSAQEIDSDLEHLATLHDAPGKLDQISDDGRYVVLEGEQMRLLDTFAQEVAYLADPVDRIILSPDDAYFIVVDWEEWEIAQSRLIEIESGNVLYETDNYLFFNTTESFTSLTSYPESNTATLIETATGNELITVTGLPGAVSFDGRYWATVNRDVNPPEVSIIDIETGSVHQKIVAPYSIPDDSQGAWFIFTMFTRDSEDLTIYHSYSQTQIIDVETGDVRFTVSGGVSLTRDSRYLLGNSSDDGYGNGRLIDIESGQTLYEVEGGALFLGPAQRYLLRKEGFDVSDWQVIDIESGEVVFELQGYFGAQLINDDEWLALWSVADQATRIIDLESGNTVHQLDGQSISHSICHPYYIIGAFPGDMQLVDESFDRVLLTASQIKYSPDCNLIFASDGVSIDVYGNSELQSLFE